MRQCQQRLNKQTTPATPANGVGRADGVERADVGGPGQRGHERQVVKGRLGHSLEEHPFPTPIFHHNILRKEIKIQN